VQVRVRHFAVLRERRGCAVETVDVAPGTTARALYLALFPPTAEGSVPVMYAIDETYTDGDTPLTAGCEIAFIPPLGGG
jgi:molybdopterin converting factor small subunit